MGTSNEGRQKKQQPDNKVISRNSSSEATQQYMAATYAEERSERKTERI